MSDSFFTRRSFLQSAATAGAAATLASGVRLAAQQPVEQGAPPYPESGTLIPDDGWHLWIDEKAAWASDDLFLPEDIRQDANGVVHGKDSPLPVSPPTGGWSVLTPEAGKEILLPTTVEQHFWGKFGSRPYTPEEYRYAAPAHNAAPPADDDVPQNGAYFGVSWWYRKIDIPAAMQGKRIFLHVRGAHLRAEVYLNQKLVGYSIMEELPFEAELTHAANPGGENILAIRITNPFGRFDWVDGLNAKWGKVSLYRSHGFGGLDRGMTISAHKGSVRIRELWVLNDTSPGRIYARASTEIVGDSQPIGYLHHEVVDPATGKILLETKTAKGPLHQRVLEHDAGMSAGKVSTWDLESPTLYHLRTTWVDEDGSSDTRTISFGFRSFAPEGLGKNALFRLNGRRIRIYSSISWGFWGLNGMFPVPELAEKEVTQAKKLGLNCLNFHRNLAKEDVLRAHDRLGLLRYMEPGAGKMAIGKLPSHTVANANSVVMEKPTSEAEKFAQRYMFVKCVEMVKAYRSHPSVIEYCLQNEIGADLKNPDTIAVLEAMRAEDPSRCIVLNDGFVAPPRKAAQAWFEPWNPKLHRSDEEAWGGWWNQHQGAGDQWYDEFYKSPTDYTYRAPHKDVITEFGEMEGCARPDNHSLMVHQITDTYKKYGGISYDLTDHEEIIASYEKFLDKWGFRKAFPTAESVFLAVGKTCYETWGNYMENARISDELDFAAISGWESTAIENHSGIVDNLRNFKADPRLISGSLMPVRPIAKQRAMCVTRGNPATFDLYLANDTPQAATGTLTFAMITPSGKRKDLITLPAPEHAVDQFSYLLKEGFETPALDEEGLYRFKFSLSSALLSTQTKELWVTNVPEMMYRTPLRVGVSGITPALRQQLQALHPQIGLEVVDFKPGERYNLIVSSGLTTHTESEGQVGETTGEVMPVMKPGHAPEPGEVPTPTQLGHLQHGILEAVQAGTPLLAIPQADTLSDGVARELAAAGAFTYNGAVGDFRAPWMGNWYFVREHALFSGMPVDQAMGNFYQAKGRQSNGLLVEGTGVDVIVGYSRDHDRKVGAGTFTAKLGKGKLLFHRVPELHPVLQQRFLANTLRWLTT
ncbi:glycoside hydrolase family 2 protein [Granulicella mallensis]|uniref:Glycoside hydrolase family 2 sugar binding protein n=1 Tax=Granulicella mallensis (strain ATCC BAA-1857 / DSM 23137 / MP5ACTX8) TaxID=682795 RepID=G8NZZ8_GRAMM|nr:glycoside hydrolase [Granulicella mallensis]AEU35714.1 glycoside hydrolase family 2 sugar binding protein [Granulicella mallensis MP5ACTX8]